MTDPRSLELRLIVKRHGLVLHERLLDQDSLSVGRDPGCDVVLDDPAAPRRVAELVFEEGGLWVVDSGSLWGISVGGEVVSRRRLWPGEEVEMGSFLIELRGTATTSAAVEPTLVGAPTSFEDARTVVLPGMRPRPSLILPDGDYMELEDGTLVLGRSTGCDILLDSSAASKRHAEIRVQGGTVTLVDLGSTNGTRVNGELVHEHVLESGDSLELADVVLQIELPDQPFLERQTPKLAGNDATVVPGAALQEQIRADVAAMVSNKTRMGRPPKRNRRLLIVLVAAVAVISGLIAILVIARRQQDAAVNPEPVPAAIALAARGPCGSNHAAWNNR